MPIAIDMFAGLGGWTEGLLAAGWTVIGFDIQRHQYGDKKYPAQLVLQDILTLHGKQFKDVDLIVASPPCTEFSYIAMPWSRGKQIGKALRGAGAPGTKFPDGYEGSKTIPEMTALFDACFRIQREACEAAGRHIPMVVENVKGAQPWVGKAKANYGSFYLWGDVQMVGNKITGATRPLSFDTPLLRVPRRSGTKVPGMDWSKFGDPDYKAIAFNDEAIKQARGRKGPSGDWFQDGRQGQDACAEGLKVSGFKVPSDVGTSADVGRGARFTSRDCGDEGTKQPGLSGPAVEPRGAASLSSKSSARKAASAEIAKIPFELAEFIGKIYMPSGGA